MFADVLCIGTELTTGAVVDTNAPWLAQQLMATGILVRRHVTVADRLDDIEEELRRSAAAADIIVVTGGLGPTRDDLTREALAAAMGEPLEPDEASAEQIRAFFARLGRSMPEANLRQAMCPRRAKPIRNDWGTAPGIRAELDRAVVYALPGVPREMREMFTHRVLPELRALDAASGGEESSRRPAVAVRVLRTFGAGESAVGERIADLMEPGRNPAVGTEASEGVISVRIIGRDPDAAAARRRVDADAAEVRARLGHLVFGEGNETLEGVVGRALAARRATLATAESCTGGLIAKVLTDVPGSSRYFVRGYVTYSNESKIDLLGVPPERIEAHGAVSDPVAEAMAVGARRAARSDYALAVTGIAGPTGGTPDKPVGLVYIALACEEGCIVHRMLFGEHLDRHAIRDRACKAALNLLRRRLGP